MANVKISQLTALTEPVAQFYFLGENEASELKQNNKISFNVISSNIYNTTYTQAYANIVSLSTSLSNDVDALATSTQTKINELNNALTSKADKTTLNQQIQSIATISAGLCADIQLSVDNLNDSIKTINEITIGGLHTEMEVLSTNLEYKIDAVKDTCATDSTYGMIKFRANDTSADSYGYVKYGLTADSNGHAYVSIPSADAGGGGSIPIGYNEVKLSAVSGAEAHVLLTSNVATISNISVSNKWFYVDDNDCSIMLSSVKDELTSNIISVQNILLSTKNCNLSIEDILSSVTSCQLSIASCNLSIEDILSTITSCELSIADIISSVTSCELSIATLDLSVTSCNLSIEDILSTITSCQLSIADVISSVTSCQLSIENTITKSDYATAENAGIIKIGYVTSENNFQLQLDENYNAFVNVPSYELSAADNDTLGGIKIGFEEYDDNYAVNISTDNTAYVNVPSYELPVADDDTLGGIKTGFEEYDDNYAVNISSDNNTAYVTVPLQTTEILELIYPVGAVYTTTSAVNPNEVFGFGTWVDITNTTAAAWTTKQISAFERTA